MVEVLAVCKRFCQRAEVKGWPVEAKAACVAEEKRRCLATRGCGVDAQRLCGERGELEERCRQQWKAQW